jgi:hypothetical protein
MYTNRWTKDAMEVKAGIDGLRVAANGVNEGLQVFQGDRNFSK